MVSIQEKNQLRRIPLLSIFGAAIVYLLWSIFSGPISPINQIAFKLIDNHVICFVLPFSISRAWDILLIGVFSFLLVKAGQYIKNKLWVKEGPLFYFSLGLAIFVVFVIGMAADFDIFSGFLALLYFVPVYVFVATWHWENSIEFDWFFSALFGILGGLFIGLKIGLVLGLLFGLILGFILAVVTTVSWLLKTILIHITYSKLSPGFKYRMKKRWEYSVNFVKGK